MMPWLLVDKDSSTYKAASKFTTSSGALHLIVYVTVFSEIGWPFCLHGCCANAPSAGQHTFGTTIISTFIVQTLARTLSA